MSDPKPQLSEHIRQRTQEWLRKAAHELAYLAVAPLSNDDPPTDTTCRIAHIAGEYALKAYLMINKHKILKSHDLVVILDECITIHSDSDFETLRSHCQALTMSSINNLSHRFALSRTFSDIRIRRRSKPRN